MKTECPHCNQRYDIDDEAAGHEVTCQKCGQSFVVSDSAASKENDLSNYQERINNISAEHGDILNRCRLCGKEVDPAAKVCPNCGTLTSPPEAEQTQTVICPNCLQNVPNRTFCQNCGSLIVNSNLTSCVDCGRKISPNAKSCPQCGSQFPFGRKANSKKLSLSQILVLIVIVPILGYGALVLLVGVWMALGWVGIITFFAFVAWFIIVCLLASIITILNKIREQL